MNCTVCGGELTAKQRANWRNRYARKPGRGHAFCCREHYYQFQRANPKPRKKPKRSGTSLSDSEVMFQSQLGRALERGADVSVLVRSDQFRQWRGKVARMRQRIEGKAKHK